VCVFFHLYHLQLVRSKVLQLQGRDGPNAACRAACWRVDLKLWSLEGGGGGDESTRGEGEAM
jgi:hypothetical protein